MGADLRAWIHDCDPATLTATAAAWRTFGRRLEELSDAYVAAVTRVDGEFWQGRCAETAHERASADRKSIYALAEQVSALADRTERGSDEIGAPLRRARGALLEAGIRGYAVAPDLTLTGPADARHLPDLQAELHDAARAVAAADRRVRDDLDRRRDELRTALDSPLIRFTDGGARDPGEVAATDLAAVANGVATEQQSARICAAAALRPDQLAALRRGDGVELPAPQFGYLRGLLRAQDDRTVPEIAGLGAALPAGAAVRVRTALADALQLASNPRIRGDGDRGGMAQLPERVRDLLVDDPRHSSLGGDWVDEQSFATLCDLVGRGDPALRSGSDLDRGILKQTADILRIADAHHDDPWFRHVDTTADRLLGVVAGDHRAISDFLTGHGMAAAFPPGARHGTGDQVFALLGHRWPATSHRVEALFRWIGADAGDPDPAVGGLAGRTADGLAHLLTRNADQLAANLPGHGTAGLGRINPGLTRTLAEAMRPYLGNFAGAPDSVLLNHSAHAVDTVGTLSKLFAVLDSDPQAARVVNTAGSQWADHLAYQAGRHPELAPSLGLRCGQLGRAMNDGFQQQLQAASAAQLWEYTASYNEKSGLADAAAGWFSALPGVGAIAGPLATSADAWFKIGGLNVPGDPAHPLPDDAFTAELKKQTQILTGKSTLEREYSLATGFAHSHPDVFAHFDDHASGRNLLRDWNAARDDPDAFIDRFHTRLDPGDTLFGSFATNYNTGRTGDDLLTENPGRPDLTTRPPR
ncbi:hypothetical protein [Nocardia sp. alder85J]|uniref:TPR repeat region-containing protein n=1 Tax=Nocardia sp. alder85J TaxID=2862949 RepID=UPI001CD54D6C|nr:hypothetical protein [Nocardia sp. alder85J]MCX4095501.1 hypothetical protein [Nocardia sp. alder85J]